MCNFHVGQKVVCVRHPEDLEYNCGCSNVPQFKQIYTIRGLETDPSNGEVYLLLEEIVNPPRLYPDGYGEECFHHSGFRPVIERKTDISVFTALLNTSKERAPA